jgi:hypothetical protein
VGVEKRKRRDGGRGKEEERDEQVGSIYREGRLKVGVTVRIVAAGVHRVLLPAVLSLT